MAKSTSEKIIEELKATGTRFFVNDNVSDFVDEDDKAALIAEATEAAEAFLRSLLIDVDNDPNSKGTAKRLAKMYVNEIFEGRFTPEPVVTSFPNDEEEDRFEGMLVIRAELNSICSHHHKDVLGVAYIGLIPTVSVLGLSKYIRLAKWHARRGTLQEELTRRIAMSIHKHTGCPDIGVYIEATHGCVSCRGVNQQNSLTQTSYLMGGFRDDASVKKEFFDNIKLQKGTG